MSITMGSRTIGDGHPCFITFEAGATHTGVPSATALVDIAADAGADAVKFQIFDPARLVADKKQLFAYDMLVDRKTGATRGVEEPLYDILVRRYLDRDGWRAVKKHADSRGLAFFATVGFEDDAEFVKELGCDSIKVGSSDVNHLPLIRYCAQTGLCIQLDTGNATIGEIETAVDAIHATGNERIIVHQCPSGYPARLPSIQLRMIPALKTVFDFPIAYSDHTPGWEMDVAAVALGANLVEKTITLDRTAHSPEHIFSLEREEAGDFVRIIRDVETAMGGPRRVLSSEQLDKRRMTRRSAFIRVAKRAGDCISESELDYRRPGTGIPPTEHDALLGMTAVRDLEAGSMLQWTDLRPSV
ncbi:MAG: N-acetylneuraminate synthase family protein [Candidatus Eremiobacteraeota bacterium]|nr:N-acetylneuraminate synthase family protein [Candidatus Eremiobacteraeota bacterium]